MTDTPNPVVHFLSGETTRTFALGVVRACAILSRQHLQRMGNVMDLVELFKRARAETAEHTLLAMLRENLEGTDHGGRPLRELQVAGLVIAWLIMAASGPSLDPSDVSEERLDELAGTVLSGNMRIEDYALAPTAIAA